MFRYRAGHMTLYQEPIYDSLGGRAHFDLHRNMIVVIVSPLKTTWFGSNQRNATFTIDYERQILIEERPNTLVIVVGHEQESFPIKPGIAQHWEKRLRDIYLPDETPPHHQILNELANWYDGDQRDELESLAATANKAIENRRQRKH